MKRIVVALIVGVLAAASVATADRGGASAAGHASLVVHNVFGLQTLELRDFAFHVKLEGDGTADGKFKYQEIDDGTPFSTQGTLWCLTVIGNEAWIGGTIERSSDPTYIGVGAWWHVVDNGEGQRGQPDITTFMGSGTTAETQAFCDSHPPFKHPFAIQEGNIQVKNGSDQ
jgi:hypothetical protein